MAAVIWVIVSLRESRVSWKKGLWVCLWAITFIMLIDMGRFILIVGWTILLGRGFKV